MRDAEELVNARKLLEASGLFLTEEEDDVVGLWLNLSDTFGWACADSEEITDNDLLEVANLFRDYGWCGLLYWASEKRGGELTEFADNNRFIEFVKKEEQIKRDVPQSTKRAYHRVSYTIGVEEPKP
jgi:hypothetical protein